MVPVKESDNVSVNFDDNSVYNNTHKASFNSTKYVKPPEFAKTSLNEDKI